MHGQTNRPPATEHIEDICRDPITHPSAWTRNGTGGKPGLACELSEDHLAALEGILERTRSSPPQAVERRQFDHPLINDFLARVRDEIFDGRGVVVIQGLTPERFSAEDLERICWGFGTHWGKAAVQSMNGDKLGHVRDEPNNPKNRGYQSSRELKFHTDAYELLGLLCVQNASSGGDTRLVSSISIHNEILNSRPDLLPALYRGFPYAMAEAAGTSNPITPVSVPVFSYVGGKISCMYTPLYMLNAAKLMKVDLPPDLDEALQYVKQVAARDDLNVQFPLEPGEMLVCHNFTNLHARTEFSDSDGKQRHLLRLWLNIPDGRPVDPALLERGAIYDRLYQDARAEA